jgi:pyruvate,orthophosphate dikinase
MEGRPVTIRLLDPPLHEFLPAYDELARGHLARDLKAAAAARRSIAEIDETPSSIRKQHVLERVRALREQNPMLGLRGVRLGIQLPELVTHAGARDLRGGVRLHARGHRGASPR